jgi:hypothetical protein
MMQHQVFSQNRHDICQSAGPVKSFFSQQVGMTCAKEKNALIAPRGIGHPVRDLDQPLPLTFDDTSFKFLNGFEISIDAI